MQALALSLLVVGQWWPQAGAPGASWSPNPWSAWPAVPHLAGPLAWGGASMSAVPSPWERAMWSQASWGQASFPSPWTSAPTGAETDPIVLPLPAEIAGSVDGTVHYAVLSLTGSIVASIRALDGSLDLKAWPASAADRSAWTRAAPTGTVVLLSADEPWILLRVRAAARRGGRFILRVAPAAVGEAVGAAPIQSAFGAPAEGPWGQTAWPFPPPPWARRSAGAPPAGEGDEPPQETPRPAAASSSAAAAPAQSPSPPADAPVATAPVVPPAAPVVPAVPPSPPPSLSSPPTPPADADAPPGVAGVVRPGGDVAGAADADTYWAVRVDEARPFVVRLESHAGADHDLVVWASNGSRSWESTRRGATVEEIVVDPVTDSWYIVRIAVRAGGRFTLRVSYR